MKLRTFLFVQVILWVLALCGAIGQELPAPSLPGEAPEGVSLEARIRPEKQAPGNRIVAEVTFDIPEKWYVYADSVDVEVVPPEDDPSWFLAAWFHRPESRTRYDEILEKQVQYFSGELRLQRVIDLEKGAPEGARQIQVKVSYQACSPDLCYLPEETTLTADLEVLAAGTDPVAVDLPPRDSPDRAPTDATASDVDGDLEERGLLAAILLSFLAGLGLALTPCVYPMIPITVSVIGATSTESRLSGFGRSLVYVLGISLMYAALGLIAAGTGRAFGTLLQHPAVYITLAAVFVLLAAAMFDLFSIQLFGNWASRLQQKVRGRAGLIGILALGMLSGVALTPCSAPVIIGAMGYVLKTGNLAIGFLIFFSIAWGMGTPLVILGTFSGVLGSLPESGAWQETVKHIFGFGLLGAALYFFGQSGLLSEFWLDMLLGGFLLVTSVFAGAFDRLTPDSSWWPRIRKSAGLLLLVGAVVVLSRPFVSVQTSQESTINWQPSLSQARTQAEQQDRSMMLYFWQDYCPACRKLERSTFPASSVQAASRELVCVKFDGTRADDPDVKEVLDRYKVRGFPTIVFVGPDGKLLFDQTLVGYVSPTRLAQAMRAAAGGPDGNAAGE